MPIYALHMVSFILEGQLAGLEALGRKSSALRRQGICTHGWLQGREGCETKCLHCGEVFATLELAREIGRELLNG